MQTRQRVILLVLVFLSVLQQGVRWHFGSRKATARLENPAVVAVAQASTTGQPMADGTHCALVHVNTAGMAELQTLPGIGPIYAERIIIARREQPFMEKRDLLRVSGIGEKRLAQIEDLICLFFEANEEAE